MQVQGKFISIANPYPYEGDPDGRWPAGTSYRVGFWSGKSEDLPQIIKLKDGNVHQNVVGLGLKPLEDITVTYEMIMSGSRPRVGKVISLDRSGDLKGK